MINYSYAQNESGPTPLPIPPSKIPSPSSKARPQVKMGQYIAYMYKVFHHGFIKNSVYPLKYRDLQLDTVATGMLGCGKYVSESTGIKITGENVTRFPPNEQKKYVLRDAELSYQTNRTQ